MPLIEALVRLVYAWLLRLGLPFYLWRLWRRGRSEPGYRLWLHERLGYYPGRRPMPGALWLHAVSLGEARAALPLIEALRKARPDMRLLLTAILKQSHPARRCGCTGQRRSSWNNS